MQKGGEQYGRLLTEGNEKYKKLLFALQYEKKSKKSSFYDCLG